MENPVNDSARTSRVVEQSLSSDEEVGEADDRAGGLDGEGGGRDGDVWAGAISSSIAAKTSPLWRAKIVANDEALLCGKSLARVSRGRRLLSDLLLEVHSDAGETAGDGDPLANQ